MPTSDTDKKPTETAEETTETTALAVPSSLEEIGDQFMPGMDETDFVPPVVTLIQGLSKGHTEDKIDLGVFYCPQSGETWETLSLVLLKVARTRVLFHPDELAAPLCQSDDRLNPRPGGKYHGHFDCENCPARQDAPWLVSPEEKTAKERDPGICPPGYTFLAVDANTGMPFILRVNGTSVSPWKTVLTTFRMRHKNVPFAAPVDVSSRSRQNAAGQSFYVMAPAAGSPFEMEKVQEYWAMAKEMQGVSLSAFEEDRAATEEWIVTLAADPDLKYTPDGQAVCELSLNMADATAVWARAYDELAEEMNLLAVGQQIRVIIRPATEEVPATVMSFEVVHEEVAKKVTREQLRDIMRSVGKAELDAQQGKELLTRAFPDVASTPEMNTNQAVDFIAMLDGTKPWPWDEEGAAKPAEEEPKPEEEVEVGF